MEEKKIAIGADHAGFELKEYLKEYLKNKNIEVIDFGCNSTESVNYPGFAVAVGEYIFDKIEEDFDEIGCEMPDDDAKCFYQNSNHKGILICGTGSGMCIAANKVFSIRAVNCYSKEIASLAVQHNNANILCLGARFIGKELAKEIVDAFLEAKFEGERHLERILEIHNLTEIFVDDDE